MTCAMRPPFFLFSLVRKERMRRARCKKEKNARRGCHFSTSKHFTRGFSTLFNYWCKRYAIQSFPSALSATWLADHNNCCSNLNTSRPVSGASVSEAFRGRRGAGSYTTCERPFLSYTGRGAFFLFGKAKRKNGGRITQVATFEQQNLPNKAKAECLTTLPACCY